MPQTDAGYASRVAVDAEWREVEMTIRFSAWSISTAAPRG
ncbi:Myo-inositol 2-dehydrogenase [Klebsiella pneumoniae]|nr:Myo-inositol 2-dehydrogenase [Klebsiella pneumoniae]